ncbi:MAG: Ig-like domain-containing protein [Gammaproteobacteria bacterium]|nr:Ig-like domain-containing protein [Gammaproteobacteria bacterium]
MRHFILVSLFTLVLAACGGGEESGDSASGDLPYSRPGASVTGSAFDGLIIKGEVSAYRFEQGVKGELLGTATTDGSGLYSLDIVADDTPIWLEIKNGYYYEEASGRKIQLNQDAEYRLVAVTHYVSGQSVDISLTFLTTLAAGYTEYLIAHGTTVDNAIITANNAMSAWVGFDISTTHPLDVSDFANATPILSSRHKAGFIAAGISEFTRQIHVNAGQPEHLVWPSIGFVQAAYEDIKADGLLDGFNASGRVSLGAVSFDATTYRETLGVRILQFAQGARNATSLVASDIEEFISPFSAYSSAVFNNVETADVTLRVPSVTDFLPASGDTLTNAFRIRAKVSDDYGIAEVSIYVDGALVSDAVDTASPALDYDFQLLPEGQHTVSIVATNVLGKSTTVERTVTVQVGAPVINQFWPTEGETVSGSYNVRADVSDDYGVASVSYYVDGTLQASASSAAFTMNTLSFGNGSHAVAIHVTNAVGKTSIVTRNIIIANGLPSITMPYRTTNQNGGYTPDCTYSFSVADGNGTGISSVELNSRYVGSRSGSFGVNLSWSPQNGFCYGTETVRVTDGVGNSVAASMNVYVYRSCVGASCYYTCYFQQASSCGPF